jgi:CIC family chloride channel protein
MKQTSEGPCSRFGIRRFLDGNEDLYMVLTAVVIGVLAGYGNVFFRYLIGFFQGLFYGYSGEGVLETLKSTPFWKVLIIPAFGGLLVGFISITFKFARGHGVPDVIKAFALNSNISPSIAVIKSLSSSITLGSGGSAGREGPIVQIGAAIGSGVGKLLRFSSNRMKSAAACGAAGGLAATFNAPIGGAMFAAEVLLGEFGIKTFSPIIISSVVATAVSRAHLGHGVTFAAPVYQLKSLLELPLYTILGLLCAVVGVAFIRTFYFIEERFEKTNIPAWLKPAVGGLFMGAIAIFSRDVMGVGYDTIINILNGQNAGFYLVTLVFLKILATSFTLGSGGSGGLFVPSLFIGAVTGGFFGWIVHSLFPGITAGSGAYALVAMSAMLAATLRAPMTAILIIFEITQSYTVILPLMLTAIIANVAADRMEKESIFTWVLTKQGVRIKRGVEEKVLESIRVKDVLFTNVTSFRENTPFRDILASIQSAPHMHFPVLDAKNCLVGMISLVDIKDVLFEQGLEDIVVAGEICTKKGIIYLQPDDTLTGAMEKLGKKDLEALPVVEKTEDGLKFIGLLRRGDLIIAYNKKVAGMANRETF